MPSTVYFASLSHVTGQNGLFQRLERLMNRLGMKDQFKPETNPLVKIHFGENGNTSYIRPVFARHLIEVMQGWGVKPFLGDTNTLYVGERSNSVDHLRCAFRNGFPYSAMGAPVIIMDGLRGLNAYEYPGIKHAPAVSLAMDAVNADGIIAFSHFKLHLLLGFGGAIKNLGMGCASRRGKLIQHSTVRPQVGEGCVLCGRCETACASNAIVLEGGSARIDPDLCAGCAECIAVCTKEAIQFDWDVTSQQIMHYQVEHCHTLLKHIKGPAVFFNFVMDVTPDCDCFGHSDHPLVPNLGILASTDPVAIDQASIDLINQAPGFADSRLGHQGIQPGVDKIKQIYPDIDYALQLDYAAELGMGSREYQLVNV
ncbi:MAG: DUF362 domain-containing protein [Bacteroidota bacterium]